VLSTRTVPSTLLEPSRTQVQKLGDVKQLEEVVRREEQVWGGDFAWLQQRLSEHWQIPNYLSVYVAYVEGQPACSGWVYFQPESQFASLYGGATLTTFRKQGLYTAVLAARVQEARQRGYRFLTTGASPMSRPILEHNGFQFLMYVYALEWQPETAR
jgi:GNAT superfamily N-acetyltransferase